MSGITRTWNVVASLTLAIALLGCGSPPSEEAVAAVDVATDVARPDVDAIGANGGGVHVSAFKDYDYPFELYWEIDNTKIQSTFTPTVSGLLGPGSVKTMVDHLDYVVARVGIDHVGIGNDFNHGSGIEGFADASEARNVTAELVERGYSAEDIMKIWSGNFLRVFAAAAAS